MTEVFNNLCPYYMALGMTYNEFWLGSPALVKAYKEAHKYRVRMRNEELWLQGLYCYNAFSSVMEGFGYSLGGRKGSKPQGYLKKPIEIGEKTEQEKRREAEIERQKAIASLNRWKSAWEQRYGNS